MLPRQDLSKHTGMLAGSGAGTTVLVRRPAEEAPQSGTPSVVIDCANDLALLGDAWPKPPSDWQAQDAVKAQKYHQQAEVIVWTPGIEKGNPLKLEPLPDMSALKHDADELEQAVGMARDALQGTAAPGTSQKAQKKRGVLHAALEYSAHHSQGGLADFIELLADLPSDAGGGITNSEKLALEMADSLRAQMQTDILLKQHGAALDPAQLFGVHDLNQEVTSDQTRISVINFAGLPALASQ
ncbi:MAG: ATPase, partial [Gammaproteobacteria bacterium]|nr:ATPase [Gammaproteobacteria bacterium]